VDLPRSYHPSGCNAARPAALLPHALPPHPPHNRGGGRTGLPPLAGFLSSDLALLYRYLSDRDTLQMGLKGLYRTLDAQTLANLTAGVECLSPSELPTGLRRMVDLAAVLGEQMPEDIQPRLNWTFFRFMQARIKALSQNERLHSRTRGQVPASSARLASMGRVLLALTGGLNV